MPTPLPCKDFYGLKAIDTFPRELELRSHTKLDLEKTLAMAREVDSVMSVCFPSN